MRRRELIGQAGTLVGPNAAAQSAPVPEVGKGSTSAAAECPPTCSAAWAVARIADPVDGRIAGRGRVGFPTLDATAFLNNMSKAAAGLYGEADPWSQLFCTEC